MALPTKSGAGEGGQNRQQAADGTMTRSAISTSTMATRVAEELKRRIIAGEYASGMKLQQEQVALDLGVSRSPVREALRQLEAEGLVILISQKGAQVAGVSRQDVSELFELRLLTEPHLLTLAIPRMDHAVLDAAEDVIRQMEGTDIGNWSALNWAFHRTLYLPADRPATLKIVERIHQTIDRYLRRQIALTGGRETAKREHERIVATCRQGHADLAASLLRVHILNASAALATRES
jgi:DNA-binding GntR family transcriptional regulator